MIRATEQAYQAQIIKGRNDRVWEEESMRNKQKIEKETRRKNVKKEHESARITREIGTDSRDSRSGQLHKNSGLKSLPHLACPWTGEV